jgi:hypothetical protein
MSLPNNLTNNLSEEQSDEKKPRGKLRIVDNYQGKYKKMNSGKYPYKRSFNELPLPKTKTSIKAELISSNTKKYSNKEVQFVNKEKHKITTNKKSTSHSYQILLKKRALRVVPSNFIRILQKFFKKINKLNVEKKNRKRKSKLAKECKYNSGNPLNNIYYDNIGAGSKYNVESRNIIPNNCFGNNYSVMNMRNAYSNNNGLDISKSNDSKNIKKFNNENNLREEEPESKINHLVNLFL